MIGKTIILDFLNFSGPPSKELSVCNKLKYEIPISMQPNVVPYRFQTMISARSNNLNLKYQRFTPSGCKDTGNRNFDLKFSDGDGPKV